MSSPTPHIASPSLPSALGTGERTCGGSILEQIKQYQDRINRLYGSASQNLSADVAEQLSNTLRAMESLESQHTEKLSQIEEIRKEWWNAVSHRTGELRDLDDQLLQKSAEISTRDYELKDLSQKVEQTKADLHTKEKALAELSEKHRILDDVTRAKESNWKEREERLAGLTQSVYQREEQLMKDQKAVADAMAHNMSVADSFNEQQCRLLSLFDISELSIGSSTSSAGIAELELWVTSIIKKCNELIISTRESQDTLTHETQSLSYEKRRVQELKGRVEELNGRVEELNGTLVEKSQALNTLSTAHTNRTRQLDLVTMSYIGQSEAHESLILSCQGLESELDGCRNALEKTREENDSLHRNSEQDIDALLLEQAKVSCLEARVTKRDSALASAKLDRDRSAKELQDVTEQLRQVNAENDRLLVANSQVFNLEKRLAAETIRQCAALESARDSCDQRLAMINGLQEDCRNLNNTIVDRDVKLEALMSVQQKNKQFQDQLLVKDKELQSAGTKYQVLQAKSQKLEESHASLAHDLEEREQTIHKLTNSYDKIRKNLEGWKAQASAAVQANVELEQSKAAIEKEWNEATAKCYSLEADLEDCKNNLQDTAKELTELRSNVARRDEETRVLVESGQNLQWQRHPLIARSQETHTQAQGYRDQRNTLREETGRLKTIVVDTELDMSDTDVEASNLSRKRPRLGLVDQKSEPTASSIARPIGQSLGVATDDQSQKRKRFITKRYLWLIRDVRDPSFKADPIPKKVLDQLRLQIQHWDKGRNWQGSTWSRPKKCADSISRRKATEWRFDDHHACSRCVKDRKICVAVARGFMELMPVYGEEDRGLLTPEDVAYWWNVE